jgi:hypothetical protein
MRRTALLLMCVLALVGSMAAQEDRPPVSPDMRKLVEALGDKDWKVASGASKGLTDAGEAGLAALIDYVRSAAPDVVDIEKRVSELIALLGHEDWETREKASVEIVRIGKPALGQLRRAITDVEDPEVRLRAEAAIAAIVSPRPEDGIDNPSAARHAAVRLIGQMGGLRPKDSVPFLIGLLSDGDTNVQYYASFALRRLTSQAIAFAPEASENEKKDAIEKWNSWWKDSGGNLPDKTGVDGQFAELMGNTLIVERGGDVLEMNPSGEVVWSFKQSSPYSAQRLPNGNTVMSFFYDGSVVEVDKAGKEVWKRKFNGPVDAKKLDSGNYLVSEFNGCRVVEVDPDGGIVWEKKFRSNVYEADRLKNGNTLVSLHVGGKVVEVDAKGNIVWEAEVAGCPLSADRLENGNTLVALYDARKVVELDAKGAVVWEVAVDGDPHDAHRLANGNTLIASYSGNTVIEVDKDGKVVWKKECRSPVRAYK